MKLPVEWKWWEWPNQKKITNSMRRQKRIKSSQSILGWDLAKWTISQGRHLFYEIQAPWNWWRGKRRACIFSFGTLGFSLLLKYWLHNKYVFPSFRLHWSSSEGAEEGLWSDTRQSHPPLSPFQGGKNTLSLSYSSFTLILANKSYS